ncbi:metallophosphoesterase [Companilactobacillus mishanensis]|uniref:Metallophosphoesterase n=1 Tax=Companilactobacillus mishanensis TaxID=2486008 RepID=A0A5P0ZHZ5_9LACO|nr:metallophosphoesterase [Companilactobacillus mishanensis]MQS45088.1 metallophosphoesterase [Companilactobacillus mishanensis]MQS52664.1 metallophosphoesterase [Companilactobacillus mishanensis]
MKLTVHDDRPLRICQLTDIHLGEYPFCDEDLHTLQSLRKLFTQKKFHLIMITGDIIQGKDNPTAKKSLSVFYDFLNSLKTPVAITYGNHDVEGVMKRSDMRSMESDLEFLVDRHNQFLSSNRESYTLEVNDRQTGELKHVIYVWDSGSYSHWPKLDHYAAIEPEQIEWFLNLPYSRSNEHTDLGFLHIPLPEYRIAANQITSGNFGEEVCAPRINSGLFYALMKKKNVKAIFAGHDHDNNFSSSLLGIQLNYGNTTGYNCYGNIPRGCVEINLHPNRIDKFVISFESMEEMIMS